MQMLECSGSVHFEINGIFSYFNEFLIKINIRFPKDRKISEKWNLFVGVESDKILNGRLCFEHFESECFERKNKSRLRVGAIPTIEMANSNDQIAPNSSLVSPTVAIASSNDNIDPPSSPMSSIIEKTNSTDQNAIHSSELSPTIAIAQCKECRKKDALINERNIEIQSLHKSLLKAQKRNWYLESIKRKLNTAFSDLKKQSLVDEELSKSLEVCNPCNLVIPMNISAHLYY